MKFKLATPTPAPLTAVALLGVSLQALNGIRNTSLTGLSFPNTYAIASAIGQYERSEKKDQNARLIARYFDVYKMYLQDNNLDDDSNSISVDNLINFVEEEIDDDTRNDYFNQSKF